MKKKIVVLVLLIAVVTGTAFASDLSVGTDYVAKAKGIFGNLSPYEMYKIYDHIGEAVDLLGKISTGMNSYKYLKNFREVVKWSSEYKDATNEVDKAAAGKAASKSMLKVLDAFVSLAGGPLYGMILPTLLKAVDQVIDIMDLHYAEITLANWAGNPSEYEAIYGSRTFLGTSWSDVVAMGYQNLAIEVIAKHKKGSPLKPLAEVVMIINALQKLP